MGKRELLLLVVFVVVGTGLYQIAAPAASTDEGFSLGRLVQVARAQFQGALVQRTVTRELTFTPEAGVTTLRVSETRGTVIIEGRDRSDVAVHLEAVLAGPDEKDLDTQAEGLTVEPKTEGEVTRLAIATLDKDPRSMLAHARRGTRLTLRIEVPKNLRIALQGRANSEVADVAGLELIDVEGELRTRDIAGPITGRAAKLEADFEAGAMLELETRRGKLHAEAPTRVTLTSERTTVEIVDPAGPVSIVTDYAMMNVRGTGGPVKVTGVGGVITLRDVRHPLTIDADRLTVTAQLAVPVETSIKVTDDEVDVDLPRHGGVELHASVEDGQLRLPQGLKAETSGPSDASIRTTLDGGGPLVALQVRDGQLRVRSRARPTT